jgi:PAP2 superfamily
MWHEIAYIAIFYGFYWLIRNSQGSNRQAKGAAQRNALQIIRFEKTLGMFWERQIQHAFIGAKGFIQGMNAYYGIAHFLVTGVAFFWCFKTMPERYRSIRNGLAFMTGLALLGFFSFPLMPPRLLPSSFGFVDTLRQLGSPWSFESGPIASVSNQFAAMPSLHFGWSSWCAVTFWPWAREHWWRKILVVAYPMLTLFAIIVTANHYILDAVGGLIVFGIGMRLGVVLDRVGIIDIFRSSSIAKTAKSAEPASESGRESASESGGKSGTATESRSPREPCESGPSNVFVRKSHNALPRSNQKP